MVAPANAVNPPSKPKNRRLVGGLVAVGVLGLLAISIVVVLRFRVFIPFRVPSGSMWPTVTVGQHIFVDGTDRTPKRGAVMVFRSPEQPMSLFMKRVVGVAGDVVEVNHRRLLLNGWEVPHCTVGASEQVSEASGSIEKHHGDLEVEFLDEVAYLVFHEAGGHEVDHQGPFTVKQGEYFVMGDDRENAYDSRMWFAGQGGGAPLANTTGRVRLDPTQPTLPLGAESLRPALDRCLKGRPTKTSPPAHP